MQSVKNLAAVFAAIREAGVPDRFTHEFLKQLGFTSSGDRSVIPVMRSLRFLDDGRTPTDRYKRYRDPGIGGAVMAEALRDAYSDLFKIKENAQTMSSTELKGAFKRVSGKGDAVAEKMATTFKALSGLAEWDAASAASAAMPEDLSSPEATPEENPTPQEGASSGDGPPSLTLRHDIHVHLPISTEVKVYDAIFRSLREHFG
jgi:hypothetical protein